MPANPGSNDHLTPEIHWALPATVNVPPDLLSTRIDIYQESILIHNYNYGNMHRESEERPVVKTRMVSADDLTRIIGRHNRFHTGLLAPGTLWKTMTANGIFTGVEAAQLPGLAGQTGEKAEQSQAPQKAGANAGESGPNAGTPHTGTEPAPEPDPVLTGTYPGGKSHTANERFHSMKRNRHYYQSYLDELAERGVLPAPLMLLEPKSRRAMIPVRIATISMDLPHQNISQTSIVPDSNPYEITIFSIISPDQAKLAGQLLERHEKKTTSGDMEMTVEETAEVAARICELCSEEPVVIYKIGYFLPNFHRLEKLQNLAQSITDRICEIIDPKE